MTDHKQPSLFPEPAPPEPNHAREEYLRWLRDQIVVDESPERQREDSRIDYDPDKFIEGGNR